MFRLTYPHTSCNLLLRPYSHVQTKPTHTLPVTYSLDLIIMLRQTYTCTVCTLLFRLYSHVHTNFSTHCLYLTSETLFLCSDKRTHALPVTYSWDPNIMFRITYTHTACSPLLRPAHHVQTNPPTHWLQLTPETPLSCSNFTLALHVPHSLDFILMFRLTFPHIKIKIKIKMAAELFTH